MADEVVFKSAYTGAQIDEAIGKAINGIGAVAMVLITLMASGWSGYKQTATVQGVLADESAQMITPVPQIASQTAYLNAGIRCTNQGANSLTFSCEITPTETLAVYVVIQGVQGQ